MGRRKGNEALVRTGFRVPRELHQAIRHRAIDEGIPLRELIRRALEQYLSSPHNQDRVDKTT
jgi:predicted DNA binding CopG/RHH family protein